MQWLVVCDLDETLVGDTTALELLNAHLVLNRDHLVLVYLTGRSLNSVLALKDSLPLLAADYLACDSGTSLWERTDTGYVPWLQWMSLMNNGWNRTWIENLAKSYGLDEQAPAHQTPFKCSYYLSPDRAAHILDALREQAEAVGAHVHYKAGFLDLLATDTAEVLDYLSTNLKISIDHTVICHDGTAYPIPLNVKSILMPNATTDQHAGGIFQAQHPYAQGILDGLKFWGLVS